MRFYGLLAYAIPLFFLVLITGFVFTILILFALRKHKGVLRDLKRSTEALQTRISRLEALLEAPGAPVGKGVEPEETTVPAAVLPEEERIEIELAPEEEERVEPKAPEVTAEPVTAAPPWTGLEETIGKRWMTWGGALALFLSAGFFLKYAFDNQWLGPTGRVVLGILAGIVLLAVGDYGIRRQMRALGQGLIGGALAILYVSLFVAFSWYHLIPQGFALLCMVVVTCAGMALAVLHEAIPLAFIAILGGFLTPVMVSTGRDARDALFSYVAILDLGVLGVAFLRRWRATDLLAFIGTWALFTGWFFHFYRESAMVPTLLWIALFFLIFLSIPFAYQLRKGIPSPVESFVLALANAAVSFGYAYWILREDYQYVLGFVALAITVCYLAMAVLVRKRVAEDTRSLFGFVTLAVVFLTLAVPLQLKVHGVTLTWAMEGPVLVFLGYLYRYRPVRIAGFLVLALAAGRLFFFHWPLHTAYFVPIFNRYFAAAMSVPLAAALYAVVHRKRLPEATDIDRYLMTASAIFAGFLALIILHAEISTWLRYHAVQLKMSRYYLSACAVTALWALGSLGYLAAAVRSESRAAFYSGLPALLLSFVFLVVSYGQHRYDEHVLFFNLRFAAGLVLAAAVFGFALAAAGRWRLFRENGGILAKILFSAAGLVPLMILSAEVYTYCHDTIPSRSRARWSAQMSLSIVWAVYAVSILVIGFRRQIKRLRVAALVLLGCVAVKVVVIDMAQVEQIYRILSFVVLGLMMISASYLYHRLEKRLAQPLGDRA